MNWNLVNQVRASSYVLYGLGNAVAVQTMCQTKQWLIASRPSRRIAPGKKLVREKSVNTSDSQKEQKTGASSHDKKSTN